MGQVLLLIIHRGDQSAMQAYRSATDRLTMMCGTHKKLEELEDPLVCENIKCIPCDGVNDRQAVNFVFDEGVHCLKQAARQHKHNE